MQLSFQATPVNLNAQVDRNNNKLHKFKYIGHARGLPGINTRSVLVREQLLGEHLPSAMHIGIHPSIF